MADETKMDQLEGGIAIIERRMANERVNADGGTFCAPSQAEDVLRACRGVLEYAKSLEARIAVLEASP